MGLRKTTVTAAGVTGEYWKVTRMSYWAPGQRLGHPPIGPAVDRTLPAVIAELSLYVDRTASLEGRQALANTQVATNVDLDGPDNLVAQVYRLAPTLSAELAGAEDVLE